MGWDTGSKCVSTEKRCIPNITLYPLFLCYAYQALKYEIDLLRNSSLGVLCLENQNSLNSNFTSRKYSYSVGCQMIRAYICDSLDQVVEKTRPTLSSTGTGEKNSH